MPDLSTALGVEESPIPATSQTSGPPKSTAEEGPETERVRKLAQRFRYCWNHPKWVKYRRESEEDEKFYAGTGQWDPQVKREMEAKGRAALTINEIRPVIKIITGYERSTRMDLKAAPEGEEDQDNAAVLSRIIKKVLTKESGGQVMSKGFDRGMVSGLAVWKIDVDYTEEPIHGRITLHLTRRGDVCWDPDAERYDLRDARELFWYKRVAVDSLKAQYPEATGQIDAAVTTLRATVKGRGADIDETFIPAQDPSDPYKDSLDGGLPLWSDKDSEVVVVEGWYRAWETVHLMVNKAENAVDEIPATALEVARELAKAQPDVMKIIHRQRRKIEMSTFIPAMGLELEHGNPFENDTEDYPFVQFCAYDEAGEIFGMVRNLKDPQREINKRRSAMIDNAALYGHIKYMANRQGVENPEALEGGPEHRVIWTRPGHEAPQDVAPPAMPVWVANMDAQAKSEIREISGASMPFLGRQESSGQSGIAISRLQQQGQIGTSDLFDNYRWSRMLIGQRVAKRIQQVYTSEMTIRLDSEAGGTEFVRINAPQVDSKTGEQTVARPLPDLKYDVEIAETPATPTARAASLALLLDLIEKFPQLAPALADIIIEMSDVPNRGEVLRRVRLIMAQAGLLPSQEGQNGGSQPLTPTGKGFRVNPAPGAQEPAAQAAASGLTP